MEKLHYIYGLYSTLHKNALQKDKIRYIGQTYSPEKRLEAHIKTAQKNTPGILYEWIRSEMEQGGKIKMTLLHQCEKIEKNYQERLFIEKYKNGLLNVVNNDLNSPSHLVKEIQSLKNALNGDLWDQFDTLQDIIKEKEGEIQHLNNIIKNLKRPISTLNKRDFNQIINENLEFKHEIEKLRRKNNLLEKKIKLLDNKLNQKQLDDFFDLYDSIQPQE
jgi:hypothetical protein